MSSAAPTVAPVVVFKLALVWADAGTFAVPDAGMDADNTDETATPAEELTEDEADAEEEGAPPDDEEDEEEDAAEDAFVVG